MDDIGKPKSLAAVNRLKNLNPFVQIESIQERFAGTTAQRLMDDYDLFLECTDSLLTKFELNERVTRSGKRALIAGIYRYEGQLQAVYPGGPCLSCLWPQEPDPSCVGTCEQVGVLGATPGVLGTWQASEALKCILGIPSPLFKGNSLLVDLIDLSVETISLKRRSECTICGMDQENRPVSMEVVPESLESYRVIDIREADERVEEPFPYQPSEWMPMSAWTGQGIDARPTLFVCRSGMRTLRIVKSLRDQGLNDTFSLPGGTTTLRSIMQSSK